MVNLYGMSFFNLTSPMKVRPLAQVALFSIGVFASTYSGAKAQNSESTEVRSPEEQQKLFDLAPGFEIELVASEKMGCKKIVDISFDTQGRMWACTASEYPADSFGEKVKFGQMLKKQGVKPSQRVMDLWEKGGIDQVLLFEDATSKSPSDPKVFGAGRALPMGVLPYKNGVIVIEGPRLLFLEDTNGDLMADRKTVLAEGFGAQDTHTGAHGLKFMPGNWVTVKNGLLCWGDVKDSSGKVTSFDRSSIAYIRPDGTEFHKATSGFQNIWGFYMDKEGQSWMHEANNGGYPIAPYYEKTAYPMSAPRKNFLRSYMAAFPPTVGPGDKPVNLEGTALSGLERSDDLVGGFPAEWQKRFLIAHPMPKKIHSVEVKQRPDESYEVTRGPDLLSSRDPNFRPVDLEFGPDGCLYIVDWYNPIISHNEVARDDPRRNKVETRVWRVRHKSQPKYPKSANVKAASASQLLTYIKSKNSWEQESAWKEISERQDKSLIPGLVAIASNEKELDRHRIHALWCLENLAYYDQKLWEQFLNDENKNVRMQAVRALRQVQPDLSVTFPMIRKLADKEKNFIVTKEILHYMGDATSLNADHIDWMMRWRTDAKPKMLRGRHISHQVPEWNSYKTIHFQDILRMALEAQPEAVVAYLQDAGKTGAQKEFLNKNVVPFLDKKYSELTAGNFTVQHLQEPQTRLMIFSNLTNEKFMRLAKKYLSSMSAMEQVTSILGLGVAPSAEVNSLLVKPLEELSASKNKDAQEVYLKGLIFCGKLVGLKSAKDVASYLKSLEVIDKNLVPLALNAFVKVNYKPFALYDAYSKKDTGSQLSKHYAYLGMLNFSDRKQWNATLASLKVYHRGLSDADKAKLYNILAEYPRTLAGLFVMLDGLPAEDVNTHYNVLRFLKDRYNAIVKTERTWSKISQKGFTSIAGSLQKAEPVKEIAVQHKRWEKLASANKGNTAGGKVLFKALCLSCHSYQGEGQGIGPSLDGTGNRPLDGLISAVVNPDEGIESVYHLSHVQFHDGNHMTGLLKSEGEGMYLYQMGGGKIPVAPSDVSYTFTSTRSFMPDYLTRGLSDQQLSDVISYLRSMK
jgi:putative membrane-bound dehydrogenase-like protein